MNFLPVELQNIDGRVHTAAEKFRIRALQDQVGELARQYTRDVVHDLRPEPPLMGRAAPGTWHGALTKVSR
jgi:hypothetical protein